ncbi:MAG: YkgJ family cysteine cluster protein [Candidatus Obscuribacterales bacterium]|nr:YkgJ family cysteine cluster protein [Candidatus Obscuribacterales bacterium]
MKLLVAPGFNFSCSRCGHCCNSYPVPLTALDLERLQAVEGGQPLPVRRLTLEPGLSQSFKAVLLKGEDGFCNYFEGSAGASRCLLQDQAKPQMCRLFPFTFLHAPDGVLSGLSFSSTAVCLNLGEPLASQTATLDEMLALFEDLNPGLKDKTRAEFGRLSLAADLPLSFELYLPLQKTMEEELWQIMGRKQRAIALQALALLFGNLREMSDNYAGSTPQAGEAWFDLALIETYLGSFFNAGAEGSLSLEEQITTQLTKFSQERHLNLPLTARLQSAALNLPASVLLEDLFARFACMRLFSRLYFGPGFSGLSLTVGLGHLFLMLLVGYLRVKLDYMEALENGIEMSEEALFETAVRRIRQVEGKWTSLRYSSREAINMLELAFLDGLRPLRLLDLAL